MAVSVVLGKVSHMGHGRFAPPLPPVLFWVQEAVVFRGVREGGETQKNIHLVVIYKERHVMILQANQAHGDHFWASKKAC